MKIKEIIIVVTVLAIDLITKYIVATNIELHQPIVIIKNFFEITYVKNIGAGFSILQGQQVLLSLIAGVVVIAMIVWLFKNKDENPILRYTVALMMAGALGNLVDRVYLGYVRDFLSFNIFGYDFPVFNVADMALSIGVAILFLLTLLQKEGENGKI